MNRKFLNYNLVVHCIDILKALQKSANLSDWAFF